MKNQKIVHLNIILILLLVSSKITPNFSRKVFSGVFSTGLIAAGLKQYAEQYKPRFLHTKEQGLEQLHLDTPKQLNQSKQEKIQREKLRYAQEWVDIVEKSQKVEELDPQFWNIFCQVKRDLGITEDIEVRVVPYNYEIRGDDQFHAMYVSGKHAILLRAGYNRESYSKLIYTLAHELEHHRQNLEYPGSYHGFNRAKQEHSADAAAAGYIQCAECLKTISTYHRCRKDNDLSGFNVEEKILNRIDPSVGYFGPKDFEPYIVRAMDDHCLCQAHQVDANVNDKYNLQNYVPMRQR